MELWMKYTQLLSIRGSSEDLQEWVDDYEAILQPDEFSRIENSAKFFVSLRRTLPKKDQYKMGNLGHDYSKVYLGYQDLKQFEKNQEKNLNN